MFDKSFKERYKLMKIIPQEREKCAREIRRENLGVNFVAPCRADGMYQEAIGVFYILPVGAYKSVDWHQLCGLMDNVHGVFDVYTDWNDIKPLCIEYLLDETNVQTLLTVANELMRVCTTEENDHIIVE